MSANPTADNFLAFAADRLHRAQRDIARCLEKLTPAHLWQRSGDYENSIANLLLHLEGNMRQWILHGIDGQPDVRRRDDEFTLTPVYAIEVVGLFNDTLNECARVITALDPGCLLTVIDPQPNGTWRHKTMLEAIFLVSGHVEMHTGQIILLTKQIIATDLDLTVPRNR